MASSSADDVDVEQSNPSTTTAGNPPSATKDREDTDTAATSANADASSTPSKLDGGINMKSLVNKPDTIITATTPSKETPKKSNNPKSEKIKVHLVAVGSAPILKKAKFLMNADDRFFVAIAFLRKVLKLSSGSNTGVSAGSSLFLYINAAFVPAPDERMGDLFNCFGARGELVVHYSLQEAWG